MLVFCYNSSTILFYIYVVSEVQPSPSFNVLYTQK